VYAYILLAGGYGSPRIDYWLCLHSHVHWSRWTAVQSILAVCTVVAPLWPVMRDVLCNYRTLTHCTSRLTGHARCDMPGYCTADTATSGRCWKIVI